MIVFDLDDTLSKVSDMRRLVKMPMIGWGGEESNWPIIVLCRTFVDSDQVKVVTSKSESFRGVILEWFEKNRLNIQSDDLCMQKNGDLRCGAIVKLELVKDFIGDIEMVFETRNSMVKKWRELGLKCFQVAGGPL